MLTHTKTQRTRMFRQHGPVEVLVWGLISIVLGYSIFIPWSWTLPENQQWLFWQVHTLVFVGCAAVHAITLTQTPAAQLKPYRAACIKLFILGLLTSIVSLLDIDSYGSVLSLLLYVYIYGGHVFGLSYAIPLRSLPRARLVRLIAFSTLLSLIVVDIALRSVLPRLITNWVWTPAAIAMEVRMAMTVSLSFLYINVYRYFGNFRGRVVVVAGLGVLAMLCTDIMFTAGTFLMVQGGSDRIYSLAIPFWDLHQLLWALALYWATRSDLRWRTIDDRRQLPGRLGQWVIVRQGVLLGVLILISSNVIPSLFSLIWLVVALLVYQAMVMLEREQLIQKQHATQEQLLEANRQLEDYAQQAKELATMGERERVARDLHDSLGAGLTAIGLRLQACSNALDKHPAAAYVASAQSLTDQLLEDARRTVHNLRTSETLPALYKRIDDLLQPDRATGLVAEVQQLGTPRPLNARIEEVLFRVVQEGVTNMRKHAHATQFVVQLDYCDSTIVRLRLCDNGKGTNSTKDRGRGLQGMRERLHAVGGDIDVQTAPNQGFQLTAEVPA